MNVDEKLYVVLEDDAMPRRWRGDVVLGRAVLIGDRVEHVLIEKLFSEEMQTVPVRNNDTSKSLIREVRGHGRLSGRELTSDFEDILVVNATILRHDHPSRRGWTHYTEPFLRNKFEARKILCQLEQADTIKVELFTQDSGESEQFDGDIQFDMIASRIGHPSNILQVNHVGGSCWFDVSLNGDWQVRVGGREGSIKSRNWFQAWPNYKDYQEKPRPKLILSSRFRS